MTNTGPATNPGNITVTGQRRRPNGSFPSGGGGGGSGEGGGTSPDIQDEQDPGQPGVSPPNPCADSATALPWNADAAGAQSISPFLSKAAELGDVNPQTGQVTLSNREFGRALGRGPVSAVFGNAVSHGLPQNPADPDPTSEMHLRYDGVTVFEYVGEAHSHPNGNPLPSNEDWNGFMDVNYRARNEAGRTNETFYMYIHTVRPDGTPGPVYVYQDGPRAAGSANPPRPTQNGPEVNPDAQPCQ